MCSKIQNCKIDAVSIEKKSLRTKTSNAKRNLIFFMKEKTGSRYHPFVGRLPNESEPLNRRKANKNRLKKTKIPKKRCSMLSFMEVSQMKSKSHLAV